MKKSFVLEVNKEIIVINMIMNYQWYDLDIKESFNKTLKFYIEDRTLEQDINEQEIKLYLKNYLIDLTNNKNTFDKFLKRLYDCHICESFQGLINRLNLQFIDEDDLQSYINRMVLVINN